MSITRQFNWQHVSNELLNIVANTYGRGDTIPKPNLLYIKKVVTICMAQCFSKHFAFFFVPQMGLTGTTTIPSNFSRAKQERMKVAHYIQMGPPRIPSHAPTLEPQNWSKVNIISRDGVRRKLIIIMSLGMQNSHPLQ